MTDSRVANRHFVIAPSQNAASLERLRAEMADKERGERIKQLRQEKAHRLGKQRITQQAMADATGVSLRAAQEWDYGGGIDDENLPALIKFLETDADYLLHGEQPETPDLMASLSDEPPTALQALAEKLDALLVLQGVDPTKDVLQQAARLVAERAAQAKKEQRRGRQRKSDAS